MPFLCPRPTFFWSEEHAKEYQDLDYEVKNVQVQESLLGVSAQWLKWQLDVSQPLMIAAAEPEAQGTESIDGRMAEKYALDSTRADPAGLEMLKGFTLFNPSPTAAHGTIWTDEFHPISF